MPPFNFGETIGRAITETFQAAQDRQLQRKRQRALNRIKLRRLAEQARQFNETQQAERREANRERQRYRDQTVQVPLSELGFERDGTVRVSPTVADEVMGSTGQQGRPRGKVEVSTDLVPGAQGDGTVMVDPGTAAWLKRQQGRQGRSASQNTGGGGDKSSGVSGFDARKVRTPDGAWKVWEMRDGEPVGSHEGLTESEADSLVNELKKRGAPTDTTTAPRDTTRRPRGAGGQRRGPDPSASGSGTGNFWNKREMLRALPDSTGRTPSPFDLPPLPRAVGPAAEAVRHDDLNVQ